MAKTQMDKDMDAIFSGDVKNGRLALVTMAKIVTDLGATRNSDPMRRFCTKARNHHHQNFTAVMGLLVRLAYGEKQVVMAKDDKHATGTSVKLKFQGERQPGNAWSLVTKAIQGGKVYNDRALLKSVREYLKPDAVEATPDQNLEKLGAKLDLVIKWIGKEASEIGMERAINEFRNRFKEAGLTVVNDPAEVVDLEEHVAREAVNA